MSRERRGGGCNGRQTKGEGRGGGSNHLLRVKWAEDQVGEGEGQWEANEGEGGRRSSNRVSKKCGIYILSQKP